MKPRMLQPSSMTLQVSKYTHQKNVDTNFCQDSGYSQKAELLIWDFALELKNRNYSIFPRSKKKRNLCDLRTPKSSQVLPSRQGACFSDSVHWLSEQRMSQMASTNGPQEPMDPRKGIAKATMPSTIPIAPIRKPFFGWMGHTTNIHHMSKMTGQASSCHPSQSYEAILKGNEFHRPAQQNLPSQPFQNEKECPHKKSNSTSTQGTLVPQAKDRTMNSCRAEPRAILRYIWQTDAKCIKAWSPMLSKVTHP